MKTPWNHLDQAADESAGISLYISQVRIPRLLALLALISDGLLVLTGTEFWSGLSLGLIGADLAAIGTAMSMGLARHWSRGRLRPAAICRLQVGGAGLALVLTLVNFLCRCLDARNGGLLAVEIALTAVSAGLLLLVAHLWRDIGAMVRAEALADTLDDMDAA